MIDPKPMDQDRPRGRRRLAGAYVILVLAAFMIVWAAQSEFILVTSENNGEFPVSSYALEEDDFHHPRLQLLRSREKLDGVVAPAKTQFEKIVLLRSWVRSQWESGGSFYYPPWDALEILDLARKHDNRGFCAQYAVVFLQACQSMGIHARYVDLPEHFVVAVWSDDYDRWVLMDPTKDIYYEQGGIPMRGRDLYRAYWENDVRGIVQVDSRGQRAPVTRDDLRNYRLYSIGLNANQLSRPVEVRINGRSKTLVHASDYRNYPKIGRDELAIASEFLAWRTKGVDERFPRRPETEDQDEFRYALNQTVIFLANERVTNRILKVALLSNNSPTFARFLIRSDGSADWVRSPMTAVKWLLHPGLNQLSARIETEFGWQGRVSDIRVYYKPPLFASLPSFRANIVRLSWHRPA